MAGWEEYPGLREACEIYGIDMDPELLHDAEYDARKTAELAIHLLTDYNFDVEVVGLNFKPGFHIHYQDTVQRMKDGLPKFKDAPSAAGGSGEELPE